MAVEPKRGCGYRQEGGLYLVGGAIMEPCDRLPFPLEVCQCCGAGIKYTRGYTWITPYQLLGGNHGVDCVCFDEEDARGDCPVCFPGNIFGDDGRAGLLWIGKQFYTPQEFLDEGADLGISRRINSIPRGFEIGKTWIFFAHIQAVRQPAKLDSDNIFGGMEGALEDVPGIFSAFKPSRIERIVKQSEYDLYQKAWNAHVASVGTGFLEILDINFNDDEKEIIMRLHRDTERGITLFTVPDSDPDHCGE